MTQSLVTLADRTRESRSLQQVNGWCRKLRRAALPAVTALLGVSGMAQRAEAQAYFWTSQGETYNWSEAGNWAGGDRPRADLDDGSADLFFGALAPGITPFAVADIRGFTVYWGAVSKPDTWTSIRGGEVNGITFFSTAGAYTIASQDPDSSFDGIVIRSGGITNQSVNRQVFNATVYHDTRFATTLNAGSGGLLFGQLFSDIGRGDNGVTLTGPGPTTFEHGVRNSGEFVQNGGVMSITGNPPLNGPSRMGSLVLNSNAVASLSNGAKLVLRNRSGIDVNAGVAIVTGANTRLDATRDGLFPQPGRPLILSTIGTGGTGFVTFSSQATGAFDTLHVGVSSAGSLTILGGAAVTGGTANIAQNFGSIGTALVAGPNSSWRMTDQVVVGNAGNGTLQVRNGGTLTSARGVVGAGVTSAGTIIVSDPGSAWAASGSLIIGNDGSGVLRIENGGVVSTTRNSFLGSVGATGAAEVTGAGSIWNTAFFLNIGGDNSGARGDGSLLIANGAIVNVGAGTNLYNTGRLDLLNATTFTGDLTSFGGLIRTAGPTTLANAMHLNAGGVLVDTATLDTNTTFSGNIDGVGGLTKHASSGDTGEGTLILTGNNTYQGPTTVNAGTLLVNGTNTSATTVNEGTLGGIGAMSGAVTIGNNVGDDAIIAPGQSIGTLATGDLTLNADAVLAFELNSASGLADQIDVTGSVSLIADALFTFTDLGSGVLTPGFSFTVINNDGTDAIVGAFGNLTEGILFSSGANQYRASYLGGTGNDLVLNVVPEPASLVMCVSSFWAIGLLVLQRPWRGRRHSPRHARNIV